jgi:AAHS family 4-hydroxybenzoate transporter-like MFS transporter
MSKAIEGILDAHRLNSRQYLIVTVLFATLIIDGLDVQLLSLVAPLVLQDFGIGRSEFGAAMSAALLGSSFGSLVGGGLGDRFGRRSVFVVATLVFGIGTALAATTHDVLGMTVLRLVGGFGFGAALPTSVALASEWLPKTARARVVSLTSLGTPLGGMLGAAFLIGLLPLLGWRGCFVLCGLVSVVFGLLALMTAPESPSYLVARGRSDRAAALLERVVGTKVSAEQLGSAADATQEIEAAAADGDSAGIFDRSNLRLNIGTWLAFFGVYFVAYGIAAWSPVLLTGAGLPLPVALRASVVSNFCSVAAGVLFSIFVVRFGSRRLLLGGSLLTLVSVVLLAWGVASVRAGGAEGAAGWAVLAGSGGIGAFNGALIGVIYVVLAQGFPPACRAGALGLAMMVGRAGGIASSFFGGALLSIPGMPDTPFLAALAAAVVLALAGAVVIDRHVKPAG